MLTLLILHQIRLFFVKLNVLEQHFFAKFSKKKARNFRKKKITVIPRSSDSDLAGPAWEAVGALATCVYGLSKVREAEASAAWIPLVIPDF